MTLSGWNRLCYGFGTAEFVDYCREIGAEPDLGWRNDISIYICEAWEFVKYMKPTDPTLKLVFSDKLEIEPCNA